MTSGDIDPELKELRKKRVQELLKEKEKEKEEEEDDSPETEDISEDQPVESSSPIKLTTENFDSFINEKPMVIVDFWADWCKPCKMVAPILDDLAQKYAGKVWVGKIDVDENPELARKYGATSIPTFWTFKDGERVKRYTGALPKQKFDKIFKNLINLDIEKIKSKGTIRRI